MMEMGDVGEADEVKDDMSSLPLAEPMAKAFVYGCGLIHVMPLQDASTMEGASVGHA